MHGSRLYAKEKTFTTSTLTSDKCKTLKKDDLPKVIKLQAKLVGGYFLGLQIHVHDSSVDIFRLVERQRDGHVLPGLLNEP